MKNQAFVLREGNEEVWKATEHGRVIPADFNCKGAREQLLLESKLNAVVEKICG